MVGCFPDGATYHKAIETQDEPPANTHFLLSRCGKTDRASNPTTKE